MNKQDKYEALETKIKELRAELEKLKAEDKKESNSMWVPENGYIYFYPIPNSPVFYSDSSWENDEIDNHRLQSGMVCKTPEEAIEIGKRMYYRQWYDSLGDVTYDMFEDVTGRKYCAYWNTGQKEIKFGACYPYKGQVTYFTSEEKCREAIDTIGEGNFLRYVLGVKENKLSKHRNI